MKRSKLFLIAAFSAVCIMTALPLNLQAAAAAPAVPLSSESQIIPYSDVLVWKYTIIDGKLYRRLYNQTKGKWVGDWELCP